MNSKPAQSFYATRSMKENVAGILKTYNDTGKIGALKPRSEAQAKKIARGIAKETRRRAKQ